MKASQINQWQPFPAPAKNQRLKCAGCKQPLRVQLEDLCTMEEAFAKRKELIENKVPKGKWPSTKRLSGRWRYVSYGHFHSQSCATDWANNELDKRQ